MRECCPTCGSQLATWTPAKIIAAVQRDAERLGRAPSSYSWLSSAPDHPAIGTVKRHFGSWSGLMAAAGLVGVRESRKKWTRESAEHALLVFKFKNGRLPTSHEWNVAANRDHPTRAQVNRLYGTWGAFIVACGEEPMRSVRSIEGYQHQAGAAARRLAA